MTVPIGFDPVSGAIVIVGNAAYPAKTLTAAASSVMPDRIQINDIGGRGEQMVLWWDVTSLDGSFTPQSMADALAYLTAEFSKANPGPRGPGILSGDGEPGAALGLAGDLYLDAISGDLYAKGA